MPEPLLLPLLSESLRLHAGLFVALLAVAVFHALFKRTSYGYQLQILGSGVDVARYAGFRTGWLTISALGLSGGMAGLAGAVEVSGVHHRLEEAFADGFGLTAIAVALMGRLHPLAIPAAAILFGGLNVGAGALQREMAIPFPLVWILQGTVVLAVLAWSVAARQPAGAAAT